MKNQIQQNIKELINNANYLSIEDQKEWLKVVEIADLNNLDKIYEFFMKTEKVENDKKFKIIFEANLSDKYKKKIESLSRKFIKTAIKKQEKYDKQGENNPNIILQKLESLQVILKELDKL